MEIAGQAPLLADMVVAVTGANGAIGGAAALAFAGEAHGLVLFGHKADNPDRLSRFPRTDHVLAVPGDIRSPDDIARLTALALTRFGRIDALVNCAGTVPRGAFTDMPYPQWQAAIDTNLTGYSLLCRALLPHMIKNRFGRIINITTRLAASPAPLTSAYTCSKAGAHMLMRCLAAEVAQQGYHNILINDLVPGPTRSSNSTGGKGQDPILVVPFIRDLLLLPAGGPTGKTYFRGQLYHLLGQP